MKLPSVLFVNRSYWPDIEATGQLLTELCEGLTSTFDVAVVAGKPNSNPSGDACKLGRADRNGVTIHRVPHTSFSKARLFGRALNYLSFVVAATIKVVLGKRADVVIVESDPPLLCFVGALAKLTRRSKLVVYLQDIHPDIGIAIGKLRPTWALRLLRRVMLRCYRYADSVVTLGDDMRQTLIDGGVPAERIACIPNWVDVDFITPVKTQNPFRRRRMLQDKVVVMYSGNMGLTQDFTALIAAADLLRARSDVQFVMVGDGVQRGQLERTVSSLQLLNVQFVDYQPKEFLAESLSAADLHVVFLDPRLVGLLMPSKIYGVMASGSASLVLGDNRGDLANLVRDHELGEVCDPDDAESIAAHISWAADHPLEMAERGMRSREVAIKKFTRSASVDKFAAVIDATLANEPIPTFTESTVHAPRGEHATASFAV